MHESSGDPGRANTLRSCLWGFWAGIAMPAMPLPIRALLRVRESPQNIFFRKLELLFKDPLEATEGFQKTRRYCMRLCNSNKSSRQ